jgi:predicted ATPase
MLSRIRLKRFKKFEDVEVELRPFTVLMGENSSGKTTILQAINFALHNLHFRELIETKKGIAQARERGVVLTLEELPGISLSSVGELYYGGKASKSQESAARIELVDTDDNIYRLQILSLFGSFNVKCVSSVGDLLHNPTLASWQPLFISGFVGLRASEERVFPRAIQNRVQTGRMSEIIRNLVLDIKQQEGEAYSQLTRLLDQYFNFHLGTVKFDEEQDLIITTSFTETRDGQQVSLDFNSSGSGLMQVLQILAPIYRFASKGNAIVLLDEPDAHLHPNLQYTLAQALREVQEELDIQIIVSTHSIPIIEAAEPSEVVPISANARELGPLVSEQDVDNAILRLIDNYHLAKSKISGKLVFVEDSNIDILRGFDKALQTGCFLGVNTVSVVPGNGKDNKVPFQSKRVLREYTDQYVEIHFVVDGDGMTNKWREHFAKYARDKLVLHQLLRHEIENYLLDPALLVRALKSKYPKKDIPSADEIRQMLERIMRETIIDFDEYFKDTLEARIKKLLALEPVKEKVFDPQAGKEKEVGKHYTPDDIDREARAITECYAYYTDFDQLVCVAKGKETLRGFNKWLTDQRKMHLSRKDILRCLQRDDVPEEISNILMQLRSSVIESPPKDSPNRPRRGQRRKQEGK